MASSSLHTYYVPTLERFGFTPTETKIYEVLLRLGASTGYAVSKEAGLARANTYQALDGLVRRGAARRSATIPAKYAALSPEAVVGELERGVRRDLDSLQHTLRALPRDSAVAQTAVTLLDDWVEFERSAVAAVRAAKEEVLAVAGPWAADTLTALAEASNRGLAVRALSLGVPSPPEVAVRPVAEQDLLAYWSGRPVIVVIDRGLALCGTLTSESGRGVLTTHGALVPFLRHLLRRELGNPS